MFFFDKVILFPCIATSPYAAYKGKKQVWSCGRTQQPKKICLTNYVIDTCKTQVFQRKISNIIVNLYIYIKYATVTSSRMIRPVR